MWIFWVQRAFQLSHCHYVPTWFDRHGLLMLPWNLKKKRRQRCEWRRRQIPLPESLVQMLDQQLPMGMQIQWSVYLGQKVWKIELPLMWKQAIQTDIPLLFICITSYWYKYQASTLGKPRDTDPPETGGRWWCWGLMLRYEIDELSLLLSPYLMCGFLRFSIHPHSPGTTSLLLLSSCFQAVIYPFFPNSCSEKTHHFVLLWIFIYWFRWRKLCRNRRFVDICLPHKNYQKLVVSWRIPFIQMMKMNENEWKWCVSSKNHRFSPIDQTPQVDGGRGQVPDTVEDLAARVWASVPVGHCAVGRSMVQWPGTGSDCPIEDKIYQNILKISSNNQKVE